MSTSDNTATTPKADVYQKVTDAIVNAIEQGAGTWRMPWHTSGKYAFSPINVTTKKPYRGLNIVALWAVARTKGYERGEWATYQQWQERGAQVRKGEKSASVAFWKFADGRAESQDGGDDQEQATSSRSRLLFCREYHVFNASQVDGYTPKPDTGTPVEQRIEQAETFFSAIDARVWHQGNRAFYSPLDDAITLPPFDAFHTPLDYYGTRAHETGHWTSKADRCNRELGKRFGDNAYAIEELVAELSAAFTMAHLGLSSQPRADHAAYIDSWLKVLKVDKRAIFTASSKAQQAADFMIGRAGDLARSSEVAA
jgi:antirestriction protein ArdC